MLIFLKKILPTGLQLRLVLSYGKLLCIYDKDIQKHLFGTYSIL